MIRLGRLDLKSPYILAPMSMYSDIGMRKICYEYGCSYAFTEQIYASDFVQKKEELKKKLDLFDDVGLQLITNDPAELKEAIRIVNEKEFYNGLDKVRSIDLNLGCPSPQVMDNNLGAALLNQPKLIRELFKVLKKESKLPVSAKIRLAINSKHKKTKPYLRIAKIAEEEGLDFITIHLRTAGQLYNGDIDLDALKEVRENVKIKLVGNGGVSDVSGALKMLLHCDAVMIGQHALKEPFIFRQLIDRSYYPEKPKEKMACIKRYLEHAATYNIGFQHVKIHMQSFLKDIPGNEKRIAKLTHTKKIEEIKEMIKRVEVR